MWDAGEVSRRELLDEIGAARGYYVDVASREYIVAAYRKLGASVHTTERPLAEQAYVIKTFADDLISENVTCAELDFACEEWRKSPERFAPNQGQILEIIRGKNGLIGFRGQRYINRLRKLADPKHTEPVKPKVRGIRTGPEKFEHKTTAEERIAQVNRRRLVVRDRSQLEAARRKFSEDLAKSIRRRHSRAVDVRIEPVEEYGSRYFSIDVLEEVLKGEPRWSSIRRFVTEKDAENYLVHLAKQKETV